MVFLLLVLVVLTGLLAAYLVWQLHQQEKRLSELEDQMNTIQAMADERREPEPMITLSVRNALALARKESRSGKLLADRLPSVVKRMVYQEVMREMEEELGRRGIESDLRLEYR